MKMPLIGLILSNFFLDNQMHFKMFLSSTKKELLFFKANAI